MAVKRLLACALLLRVMKIPTAHVQTFAKGHQRSPATEEIQPLPLIAARGFDFSFFLRYERLNRLQSELGGERETITNLAGALYG